MDFSARSLTHVHGKAEAYEDTVALLAAYPA